MSHGSADQATTTGGLRTTRQRTAITQLLQTVSEFHSAQQLHDQLKQQGENIGLTTVYRTLQTLEAAGAVDALRNDSGETLYRKCSQHHHHHLVCRDCGFTVEVEGAPVERWAERVADDYGFTRPDHTVEVFGTCQRCERLADCASG